MTELSLAFKNPLFLALCGIAISAVFYLVLTIKKPKAKQGNTVSQNTQGSTTSAPTAPAKPTHEPLEVRLYDSITRTIDYEELEGKIIDDIFKTWRSLGRKWLIDGKWVYAINRYIITTKDAKTGEIIEDETPRYRPVEALMRATRDFPPSLVHSALVHPEIEVYFDVREPENGLKKYMGPLLVVLAMLFVMWMWSSSK